MFMFENIVCPPFARNRLLQSHAGRRRLSAPHGVIVASPSIALQASSPRLAGAMQAMPRQRSAMRIGRAPARIASALVRVKAAPKMAMAFYQSPEWKALKIKRRRDPDYAVAKRRCQDGEWLVLDHIVEIKDGGAMLDPANTQWLTNSEHQAKTALRKRQRAGMDIGSD